ncbi:hypothetical protein M427DRAFT_35778 [Gonapodya prolifera JEL478]|uniref:Uncharacterized protein n=1 Tax=Gonapodya prolifera (strain JEL478) TaxID=1344416 RepID=A0A139A4J0_GONPJ|nr:hypothetical protein M427DRAFT_35778 [Gonapodya prolifera JEL478]|eukprot:KXS11395.1 hypothetical protein M427DRAFT_35778 [Gonapodya prolifera JEL478]
MGISLLQAQDGWTDEAKLKARNRILSDNFKDTATRAQVIEECKTRLGIVSKKGKEKEPHSTVNTPPPLSTPRSEVLSDIASDIPKPKATRGPPLVQPFTLPTITLIDLQTLEDALKEFLTEHGQTADLVILDFLLQDHADQRSPKLAPTFQSHLRGLRDLALNKILTPKGILMEKEASNDGTIFSATNAMAQFVVASKSLSPINWSEGAKWRHTWASTNFLGPHTVPDADVLTYAALQDSKKAPKSIPVFSVQVPSALWMEVLTLLTNASNHVVIPSVGTGSAATACALLGRRCTLWVFDTSLHSALDNHLIGLEAQSAEDASKSKATKPMLKGSLSDTMVVEDDLEDLVTFDIPPEGGPSGVNILHNSQGVPLDDKAEVDNSADDFVESEENKLEEHAESEPLMDPSLGEALEEEAEETETEDEEPTPSHWRHIPKPTPASPTSAPLKGTVEEGDEEGSEEVPSTLVDTQPALP